MSVGCDTVTYPVPQIGWLSADMPALRGHPVLWAETLVDLGCLCLAVDRRSVGVAGEPPDGLPTTPRHAWESHVQSGDIHV